MGLLRIRGLGDVARCQQEADHLHNLPGLLTDFRPELLKYYWDVERVCHINRTAPNETGFEGLWQSLSRLIYAPMNVPIVAEGKQQTV